MPHSDNSNWHSILFERPVPPSRVRSVGEIEAIRARFDLSHLNVDLPDVAEVRTDVIVRGDRRLTAEVYSPHGTGPFPLYVYFHGGGYCVGSAEACRRPGMRVAERGFVVVNVDYALAPENPFPAAVEDAVYATRWAVANSGDLNVDPARVVVAGDSAGAGLAAAVVQVLHGTATVDAGGLDDVDVDLMGTVLFCGLLDYPAAMQSPGSNAGAVEVMWNQAYLGPNFLDHQRNPLVSAAYSPDLASFPPCYLSCGDEDSLLGNTLEMAARLAAARVPTTLSVVAGLDHVFHYAERQIPDLVTPEIERILDWLCRLEPRPVDRRRDRRLATTDTISDNATGSIRVIGDRSD